MIVFENEIDIARPVEDVFAYVSDLENIPAWNDAIERTSKVTSGPVGVGTRYRQRRSLPRPAEESIRISEYQPPETLVLDGRLGPFDARMSYTFEGTVRGTTRLTNEVELRPTGTARLIAPLAANRIRDAVLDNLGALKRKLEET